MNVDRKNRLENNMVARFQMKHITMSLIILWRIWYNIYGDPCNVLHGNIYFFFQFFIDIFLCHLILKSQRDQIFRFAIKWFYSMCVWNFSSNLISIYDENFFDKLNESYEAGGVFIILCIIYLIYYKKWEIG